MVNDRTIVDNQLSLNRQKYCNQSQIFKNLVAYSTEGVEKKLIFRWYHHEYKSLRNCTPMFEFA